MGLTTKFQHFAGREVAMVEERITFLSRGITKPYIHVDIAQHNPVIDEMRAEANTAGLTLCFLHIGKTASPYPQLDRLNVRILQGDDGKWRIGEKFEIG